MIKLAYRLHGEKGIRMRKAYFEDGAIIESTCGKAHFKWVVARHRNYCRTISGKRPRVWFKPCDEWKAACDKEWREFYKKIGNIG